MTAPVPPAEPDTPRDVLSAALPTDPEDGTVVVRYDTGCACCPGAALYPQWGQPETVADQLIAALSAAGYRTVKDDGIEYGYHWPEAGPFDDDPADHQPDWDEHGVCREPDFTAARRAADVWTREGFVTDVVQRRVGPWTPVGEENRNDG